MNVKQRRIQILKMVADHERLNRAELITSFDVAGGIDGTDSLMIDKHLQFLRKKGLVALYKLAPNYHGEIATAIKLAPKGYEYLVDQGVVANNIRTELQDSNENVSKPLNVFLCHSSADKRKVRNLYKKLLTNGFNPWLDEVNLKPGELWEEEITKSIRSSDVVLVCLSKTSVSKAGFVNREIKFALDRADEQPEGAIYLIPVVLEPCDIPYRLSKWHYVELYKKRGYENLVNAMNSINSGD